VAEGPPKEEVRSFLRRVHGRDVDALEPLSGGFWSSAYAYRVGAEELVARFGQIRSGFESDRAAMAYGGPDLPVPEVLEIGDAFGGSYCISRRHHGRFLEDVEPHEAPVAGPMLQRLLRALRNAPADALEAGSWCEWLLGGLREPPPDQPTAGWTAKLASRPEVFAVFEDAAARVDSLARSCPERRDLVHGDLLHSNVLISPDASRVTAVFSWKCAVRGDFLFDVAWCTLWGEMLHPGIAALDVYGLVVQDQDLDGEALEDAALRHHCYELQIATSHLGWYAWTGDAASLDRLAGVTRRLLLRRP
jgi:aminoglycoside phosphotransferase (APT) family kinase protein